MLRIDPETMKTSRSLALLIVLCLPLVSNSWGQDFTAGNRIQYRVQAICSPAQSGALRFRYSLTNRTSSSQSIWVFAVFTLTSRDSIQSVASPGWEYGIPTNELFASVRWTPPDSSNLRPNSSAVGFEIVARGLPGIVDAYAEGYHEPPSFQDGMATDSIPGYSDLTPYGPGVVCKTIGPVNTLRRLSQSHCIDTLTTYVSRSLSQGWLRTQSRANKYLGFLSSARTKLAQHDTVAARSALHLALEELETEKAPDMTSEAYALLRYNIEYVEATLH